MNTIYNIPKIWIANKLNDNFYRYWNLYILISSFLCILMLAFIFVAGLTDKIKHKKITTCSGSNLTIVSVRGGICRAINISWETQLDVAAFVASLTDKITQTQEEHGVFRSKPNDFISSGRNMPYYKYILRNAVRRSSLCGGSYWQNYTNTRRP